MTQTIAVLDSNVLIPENLGSFLATCAYTGSFTPVLSTFAFDEVVRNFPIANNRMAKMESAFAEYFVTPTIQEIKQVKLWNSPEDAHIVAAALISKAQVIVTKDLALTQEINAQEDFELKALSPFEFLVELSQTNAIAIRNAVALMASMRKRPEQWTPVKVIESLIDFDQLANSQFIQSLNEMFTGD